MLEHLTLLQHLSFKESVHVLRLRAAFRCRIMPLQDERHICSPFNAFHTAKQRAAAGSCSLHDELGELRVAGCCGKLYRYANRMFDV